MSSDEGRVLAKQAYIHIKDSDWDIKEPVHHEEIQAKRYRNKISDQAWKECQDAQKSRFAATQNN
jgi:hypothetical protein